MTGEKHLVGLGKVVGNLHALEHVLRVFLCEASGEKIEYPTATNSSLPETHLTSYASLSTIVEEYNARLSAPEQMYRIDPTVVRIRDAIAHGRLASLSPTYPLTLYKFGKADKHKRVPIEYVEELSEAWFETNRSLVFQQIKNVQACSKSRGYKQIV